MSTFVASLSCLGRVHEPEATGAPRGRVNPAVVGPGERGAAREAQRTRSGDGGAGCLEGAGCPCASCGASGATGEGTPCFRGMHLEIEHVFVLDGGERREGLYTLTRKPHESLVYYASRINLFSL